MFVYIILFHPHHNLSKWLLLVSHPEKSESQNLNVLSKVKADIASYLTSILFVVQNRRTPILSEVTMHPAQRLHFQGFLGGPVVGNPPANAGDTGTIPDLGGFPRVTWQLSPCGTTAETICCNY